MLLRLAQSRLSCPRLQFANLYVFFSLLENTSSVSREWVEQEAVHHHLNRNKQTNEEQILIFHYIYSWAGAFPVSCEQLDLQLVIADVCVTLCSSLCMHKTYTLLSACTHSGFHTRAAALCSKKNTHILHGRQICVKISPQAIATWEPMKPWNIKTTFAGFRAERRSAGRARRAPAYVVSARHRTALLYTRKMLIFNNILHWWLLHKVLLWSVCGSIDKTRFGNWLVTCHTQNVQLNEI